MLNACRCATVLAFKSESPAYRAETLPLSYSMSCWKNPACLLTLRCSIGENKWQDVVRIFQYEQKAWNLICSDTVNGLTVQAALASVSLVQYLPSDIFHNSWPARGYLWHSEVAWTHVCGTKFDCSLDLMSDEILKTSVLKMEQVFVKRNFEIVVFYASNLRPSQSKKLIVICFVNLRQADTENGTAFSLSKLWLVV